ncbi:ATP-binding cassette domain-containing protein [Tamlana sp. 2_MG-2023]|uniref:ATP-binding cassette domain-containing protein n=1 Tax=unclassified Tamlana TaxID=2614803 RepID=UPI0026E24FC9|nr:MULTISPECIES: ATP-binding cassette domain-containing protein [unclassified Tamlana]MDO6759300.1 ATP-binding cassette domain-containing protein [Tamlana sp. 2_MG-2023]MDO6790561.1 ATP-binding cassette domain-containing protein [Tamlana sp. 1_MG-2023]
MLIPHVSFYISNKEDKGQVIESIQKGNFDINFSNLKGALFSEITLNKFIQEEIRHEQFDVETIHKNSLKQASEGERKKALLKHIIALNPEYIIVDNVFDSLDVESQSAIVQTLLQLSKTITIVQILTRKRDLLPFIENIFQLKNKIFKKIESIETASTNKILIQDLPNPEKLVTKVFKSLVKFNEVTIKYGERVIVKDICWEIKSGEFWQLIGPNGSGKSTLITLITGDNPKAYGQDIVLFGMQKGSGERVWDIKNNIGHFSAEILRGFRRLDSIEKMILSGFYDSIGLYRFPTERQKFIAHDWLKLLGLFEVKHKDFLSLSVGQQRLVLIARAMVKHPPLLILDEPTNGLDDADAQIFSELVNKIASESKTAILYVSHRKEESLLNPDYVFELTASKFGSTGKVL